MVLKQNEPLALALANRLEVLLDESNDPQADMAAIESLVEDAGYHANPSRDSNRAFSRGLFLNTNLGNVLDLAQSRNFNPESSEVPVELLQDLLPGNGHLE